ncbi:MAG: DUF721 domain-containing protein [Vicinamibacteria bacterium]
MKRTRSVADLIREALPPRSRDRIYSLELIGLKWPVAVGTELASRSAAASFEDGVLTVRVADAAWGRMILKLQAEIRSRLNAALGFRAVKRIRFVKDGKPLSIPAPVRPDVVPLKPVSPSDSLRKAAESLEDSELKDLMLRTATRYLAAQDRRSN